jgi:hypothetical protein
MSMLRKTLVTATAAPALIATGAANAMAATDAPAARPPSVIPCCGGTAVIVTWQNQNTDDYLHVAGASKGNSADVNTAAGSGSCSRHGHTDLQCAEEWSQLSTNYAHEFAFANVNSGLCLDDPEDKAGQVPVQYSCGAFPVQRRWEYTTTHSSGGKDFYNVLQDNAGDICAPANNDTNLDIIQILTWQIAFLASPAQCDWQ